MFKGLRKKASLLSLTSTSSSNENTLSPVNSSGAASGTAGASGSCNPNHSKVLKQVKDFEIALQAMDYLLDDRSTVGTDLLQSESTKAKNSSSDQPAAILPLALGVMEFIEATLGFEPEVMTKAHNTLSEAETASLENGKYNVKHKLVTSHIYPPGTEFQVTYAESTLLNALVMLLRENNGMMEQAKALFKLRKAYHALDGIYKKIKDSEPAFRKNLAKLAAESDGKSVSTVDLPGFNPSAGVIAAASTETPSSSLASSSSASLTDDVKLMRDLEAVYNMRRARIEGTMIAPNVDEDNVNLFSGFNSSTESNLSAGSASKQQQQSLSKKSSSKSLSGSNGFTTSTTSASGIATPRPSTPSITVGNGRPASPMQMLNSRFLKEQENKSSEKGEEDVETDEDEDEDNTSFASADEFSGLQNSQKFFGSNTAATGGDACGESILSASPRPAANHLHVSTVDEFIHSGVQLCFGILQVVLSLIPPAIGKVLSIVGFRGDRETGLKMLWRTAITSRNIHGELALLCLLVFYDGPVQFVDVGYQFPGHEDSKVSNIIPIDNLNTVTDKELEVILKNPALYTPQLTTKARRHFPHNALWLLQECRILASKGDLDRASQLMQDFPTDKIQMQQIEALLVFDRAMLYAFKHQYDEAARDFIALIDINSWSKGVYLFMAACCYLSKMRMYEMGLVAPENGASVEDEVAKYAKLAEKYFKLAPTYVAGHSGSTNVKTGGIGGSKKQMPFDKFLMRKLQHVEQRQKKYPKLSFVECFGTSPIHEIIYFWNGYNRMTERELDLSIKILGYTGESGSDYAAAESLSKLPESDDEAMIRYFLQGVALRSQGKVAEGLALFDTHVLPKYVESTDHAVPFKFTKLTHSPYLYPTALYEKSMFIWMLRTSPEKSDTFDGPGTCRECKEWLKKAETVGDIGDYELSNRTGMRIKAATDRLDQLSKVAH